ERAGVLEDPAPADDFDAFGLGHPREPTRELADDALGPPLPEGVERDPRLAEVQAELFRALDLAEHRRDVQQRLRRDAALPEAGAAEAPARVYDDRLKAELGAAERRRVAARAAAHDGHVHPARARRRGWRPPGN